MSNQSLLIDTCYRTSLEARTDWLGLEVIMIMNDLREEDETAKDVAGYPKLIKRVREQFTDSTEELARKAILKGELTVGDFADGILEFYEALPRGFFDNAG